MSSALEPPLRRFFETHHTDVMAVYLYGSEARGAATPASDIDLAILYPQEPAPTFAALPLSIEAGLEQLLGRPVQIIVLNRAPADLVHRVFRDGHVLVDRDRAARIRFEVRARNEFFDLATIRDRYRHGTHPVSRP